MLVESIWKTADASTDDAPTPTVPAAKMLPAESMVVVAVPPKYAFLKTEKSEVDALENEERPVNVDAPVTASVDENAPVPPVRAPIEATLE